MKSDLSFCCLVLLLNDGKVFEFIYFWLWFVVINMNTNTSKYNTITLYAHVLLFFFLTYKKNALCLYQRNKNNTNSQVKSKNFGKNVFKKQKKKFKSSGICNNNIYGTKQTKIFLLSRN